MAENDGFAMGYAMGQDSGGGNSGNGMWGGDGGWLWIIVVFALLFGWGGNGFGGNGGGQGALTRSDLCSEFNFNGLENAVRGVQNGLCDGFYAMNTSMLNGFHGVDNAICNLGYNIQNGFNTTNVAMMQGQNALQAQLAQCCCDNREAISNLKYDMATSDCSIKTLISQLIQQVMWGQQSGLRDLTELINTKFCNLELSQKDAIIADLRAQIAQCGDQNVANSIVARLSAVINPPAVPSYPAANPNWFGNWAPHVLSNGNLGGCGCNSCGC